MIGRSANTRNGWVKTARVDKGKRACTTTDGAEQFTALEQESRAPRQADEIPSRHRLGLQLVKWSQEIEPRPMVDPNLMEGHGRAKRRNVTDRFKAQAALEALQGDLTAQEIAARRPGHANQERTSK